MIKELTASNIKEEAEFVSYFEQLQWQAGCGGKGRMCLDSLHPLSLSIEVNTDSQLTSAFCTGQDLNPWNGAKHL